MGNSMRAGFEAQERVDEKRRAEEAQRTTTPTSPPGFRDGVEAAAKEADSWEFAIWDTNNEQTHTSREVEQMVADHRRSVVEAIRAIPTPDTLPTGWNSDMGEAPRDGTPILAALKTAFPIDEFLKSELAEWNGKAVVVRWPPPPPASLGSGWHMDAPVGYGGFPDGWFAGWMPLPPPPPGE